jgi:DNA-binding transcriptional MerR regulator
VEKSPDAFRTISEVAKNLDVPQHVLRFWESRFREIKPMKRGGGRRYYRPDDVDLLRGIRHLLYGEGYTIRGVQRILREQGLKFVQAVWQPGAPQPSHGHSEDGDFASRDIDLDSAKADAIEAERGRGLLALLPSLLGHEDEEPLERPRRNERHEPRAPSARRELLPSASASVDVALPREDLRKLQLALDELAECRRLIDAAFSEAASLGLIGASGALAH